MAESRDNDEILWRTSSSAFFSLKGLSTRTGYSEKRLDVFAVKKLLDNALDACDGEDPPFVTAKARDRRSFLSVKWGTTILESANSRPRKSRLLCLTYGYHTNPNFGGKTGSERRWKIWLKLTEN